MKKLEYKSLSKRARSLLAREEDYDVEFKKTSAGLDNEDMVAFANSERGGAILIGVEETTTRDDVRMARIVGCSIGDREKLSIISKAESCIPPVDIEIIVENSNHTPFYRIEVASGDKKPYCTSGGKYKIRGNGRNMPLLPGRLLSMFVEAESQQFLERFREASRSLERSLTDTKTRIVEELKTLLKSVENMGVDIEEKLEHIFNSATDAEYVSSAAMESSDETLCIVQEIDTRTDNVIHVAIGIDDKLDALLRNFNIEDPSITRMRVAVKMYVKQMHLQGILKTTDKGGRNQLIRRLKQTFPRATKKQLNSWYTEVMKEIVKDKGE